MKKIGILQSNYIPWKGYFDLINMADIFVLYDDANYTKNDWRNRNKIPTPHGVQWISIPVRQESLSQKIAETKVANQLWRKKHWTTISQTYARSQYFNMYRGIFEQLYLSENDDLLSQINFKFIKAICDILGMTTKIKWSMDYQITSKDKTEKLIQIITAEKADIYVSGPAAKDYIDNPLFHNAGIALEWMDYGGYKPYRQLYGSFEHGVSIIDLIFNEGPNATQYMKSFTP